MPFHPPDTMTEDTKSVVKVAAVIGVVAVLLVVWFLTIGAPAAD